jgi:Flp pilus assembly protein TadD
MAAALIERRPGDYPEIETDETGFTITEQIRISGEVRGGYQNALQMLAQQRYDEGIALLVEVTEEAPDVTAPHIDLGIAYGRSGDLERAEAALRMAAQLSPGHPIVHNELGIVYRKTGRFAAARASYEKALETYPGFHYARRNLAVLCDLYLADLACALKHYEAYLGSVNADAEVEIWIADIRNRLGQ